MSNTANQSNSKSVDEVYEDRNILACALVESYADGSMGGWTPAPDTDSDEWAIVWMEFPMGQASWHVPRALADSLVTRNDDYDYDGHNRIEKNDRLASWCDEGCWY